MNMHTASSLAIKRFRQEGRGFAPSGSAVTDKVLDQHGTVGHDSQRTRLDFQFQLAGTAYFVMMILNGHAALFQHTGDFVAVIVGSIHRRSNVVAAFMINLIAVVVEVISGGPSGLRRFNLHTG